MKFVSVTICLLVILTCTLMAASAQQQLVLDLTQNSGFNDNNGLNGAWTITPLFYENGSLSNATYIEYYLDDKLAENATTFPFSWSFDTKSYSEGAHVIKVVAFNATGDSVVAKLDRNFVGFPFISVVGAVLFASFVFAFVLVFSWFWIHKKARVRRTRNSTLSV